jgi:hypothetical protein
MDGLKDGIAAITHSDRARLAVALKHAPIADSARFLVTLF